MIICSSNNVDFIQGVVSYGNEPSITDWRIANSNGILNFFNSKSSLGNLSILENGNIIIGNASQTGSLNVYGDIDITGVYKNNSRNVINDTSNYVFATSNISISNIRSEVSWGSNYSDLVGVWGSNYVSRIFANVGSGGGTSQWISSNASIYYNTSNVGIGTFNPQGNLHIYNDLNPPKIIIQDGKIGDTTGFPASIITDGTAGTTTTTIGTTDKCTIFTNTGGTQTTYTITIPTNGYICDVLVVGGGGSGGRSGGGGGGVLYTTNVFFPAGSYTLRVGNGGISTKTGWGYANVGLVGNDSEIVFGGTTIFSAKGGGEGAANLGLTTGGTGGSGGGSESSGGIGAVSSANIISTNTSSSLFTTSTNQSPNGSTIYGNIGSLGVVAYNANYAGGGGGGAGGAGVTGNNSASGAGGSGINNSITGTAIMYGSGGSGGVYNQLFGGSITISGAVTSGGGSGAYSTSLSGSGVAAGATISGRGGGGGGGTSSGSAANFPPSDGGSGVIIIRFRKVFITTSSIDFVRGTTLDGNRDYSIGNYIGEFKILSRTFNTESTFFRIAENGTMYNAQGTTNFTSASDRRVKENIEIASYDKCYENINNLGLYRFNYIKNFNNINKDNKQLGFIAQEVQEYFPKAVSFNNYNNDDVNVGDLLTLDVSQINYTLYGAVKKLIKQNEDKDRRIKRLETLLNIEDAPIDTSNISIDTSNIALDTSNITLDTSNIPTE